MQKIILILLLSPIVADVEYNSEIQPIFDTYCTTCHGNLGGLNLSSYDDLMLGGISGDIVVPYNHITSELWQRINSGQMPPGNNDLSNDQINLIAQWIDGGALPEASTPLVGDINSDGIVNILDVVGLINIILGTAEENSAGDLNSDGLINILDVVLLVNNILS